MQKVKVLGVFREPMFSHNAVEADRNILEESLLALEDGLAGLVEVDRMESSDVPRLRRKVDLILTMAQGQSTLSMLERIEKHGVRVCNSTAAVRSCYRKEMSKLLGKDANYPTYALLDTETPHIEKIFQSDLGYWIKRGDVHAVVNEDVCFVKYLRELPEVLQRFRIRDIPFVIVQRHVYGKVVKFYGVRGGFFNIHSVGKCSDASIQVSEEKIRKLAEKAAKKMGLEVYGGDCVIDNIGTHHIIDMNDWPSFRTCRAQAALAVANFARGLLLRSDSSMNKEKVQRVTDGLLG